MRRVFLCQVRFPAGPQILEQLGPGLQAGFADDPLQLRPQVGVGIRFGHAVARIVTGYTDTTMTPKPPWRKRKEDYLEDLESADPSTLLVSCCDKLHNARSIVTDLRDQGEQLWSRFKGGKDGTLWYYTVLAERFSRLAVPKSLVEELNRTVTTMRQLAGRPLARCPVEDSA